MAAFLSYEQNNIKLVSNTNKIDKLAHGERFMHLREVDELGADD
jgi:hypothetical protein